MRGGERLGHIRACSRPCKNFRCNPCRIKENDGIGGNDDDDSGGDDDDDDDDAYLLRQYQAYHIVTSQVVERVFL